jgi:mannitol/fructose-specific phosphotransferase system IIA component (Ntr-type)
VGLGAQTKEQAINELIDRLAAEGLLGDVEQVRRDVFAREATMSTGLTNGLAIPHAKSEGATDLAVAMGISHAGIDFRSIDGKPTHVILLLVSRIDRAGPHLECLAEIAKFWHDEANRNCLASARTADDSMKALGLV